MSEERNYLAERFPEFRKRILELGEGNVTLHSLITRYNDVCSRLEGTKRKTESGRPEERELDHQRAELEAELLSVLNSDQRI